MKQIETRYNEAVQQIKSAILQSQLEAAKAVNRQMLALYYGIGKYVSDNTRTGAWGTGAIETISEQLRRELPGLRGFSPASIKKMRIFYEQWSKLINRSPMANDLQTSEKQDVLQANELLSVNRSPLANDLANTRLYTDVCSIIEQGRKEAYASVNHKMIETYWNIGRRIVEEEQNGEARAEYGAQIIAQLSEQLTHQYGKGFSKRNLAYFRQFYLTINDIRILQSRLQNLAWTHIINPTIGIVLCSETSKDIARYSILKDSDHLFATKYKTYLPTEEQLRTEIERQKQLFYLQHGSK